MSKATCSGSALRRDPSPASNRLLLNIPSHERSTLFHQLLTFEASIPWEERKRSLMIRLIQASSRAVFGNRSV